jgi:hypothetical protein
VPGVTMRGDERAAPEATEARATDVTPQWRRPLICAAVTAALCAIAFAVGYASIAWLLRWG